MVLSIKGPGVGVKRHRVRGSIPVNTVSHMYTKEMSQKIKKGNCDPFPVQEINDIPGGARAGQLRFDWD